MGYVDRPVFDALLELHDEDVMNQYDNGSIDDFSRQDYKIETFCINCGKSIDFNINSLKRTYKDLQCDNCKGLRVNEPHLRNVNQFIQTVMNKYNKFHNVDMLLKILSRQQN